MPDITQLNTESIIFGGLTFVALALVNLIYKLSKYYYNHTGEVIERNTKAFTEMSKSNQYLADTITTWHLNESRKKKKQT